MRLYHRRGWRAAALGVGLLASAFVAAFAWYSGRWGLLVGALLAGLTAREREVLVSLTTLGTNKAIAKELDISPRTVEKYRATILVRLGVENSAQAIRVAVEGGALQAAQLVGSSSASTGRVAVGDVIG